MKTGCIRHPENAYLIIRREWQIRMLNEGREKRGPKKDNYAECGAELMSVFEFHFNNRMANRMLRSQLEAYRRRHPAKADHPLGDWMPYSENYLRELLLGSRSGDVVDASLDLLESKGVISRKVPADIKQFYTGNCTWVRFLPAVVNAWIDANCVKTWDRHWNAQYKAEKEAERNAGIIDIQAKDKIKEIEDIKKQSDLTHSVCAFHQHIHAKTKATIYDQTRKGKVTKIIEAMRKKGIEEQEVIGRCALAIIGNRVSEFHQGTDKNNSSGKVYDDIKLIFRDTEKFDNHIGYAEAKNITWKMAYNEFEGFLKDIPSRYAKKPKKVAGEASEREQKAIKALSPEVQRTYREFARSIGSFFGSNVENEVILDFCETNQSLAKFKGLDNAPALVESLITAVKVFNQNPPDEMIKRIEAFAETYCEKQKGK